MSYEFENLSNFRDVGGIKTKYGKVVSYKKLLRSGDLSSISSLEIDILKNKYELKQIVDFRTESEVKKKPDVIIPNTIYHNLDVFGSKKDDAPSIERRKDKLNDPDGYLTDTYKEIINTEVIRQVYRDFFRVLLNNKTGSTIFHCFAGKDRTGLAAALVLYILGVSNKDIMKDFLLTNELRKKENSEILKEAENDKMNDKDLASLEKLLTVNENYLKETYKEIISKYESVDLYIKNILKFSEEELKEFRDNYLE